MKARVRVGRNTGYGVSTYFSDCFYVKSAQKLSCHYAWVTSKISLMVPGKAQARWLFRKDADVELFTGARENA